MAKILHLTHTDIDADPRILRAIKAGVSSGHQVSAIGVGQSNYEHESPYSSGNPRIINIVRPKYLRRRNKNTSKWDKEGHLEVSQGTTGPVRRMLFLLWLTARFWRMALRIKPEIIHAHDTLVLPIAVFISITLRSKVIYDAHELESDKAGSSRFQQKMIFLLEKISWRWVRALITVSDAIGDWYFAKFGSPRAVIVLNSPMLTSPKGNQQQNSTVRKDINATKDDIICLYLGAFETGRGIERLIEAFSSTNVSAKLVLLGDGSLRPQIQQSISGIGNVHALPPVKHDELVEYISDANYGFSLIQNVSLSDYLCLPNKMFEYLNAGITVICSDFPEMRRVTLDNNFGFVIGESDASLKDALIRISGSPAPQKIPISQIRPFLWETQESKLQALYNSMTKSI